MLLDLLLLPVLVVLMAPGEGGFGAVLVLAGKETVRGRMMVDSLAVLTNL